MRRPSRAICLYGARAIRTHAHVHSLCYTIHCFTNPLLAIATVSQRKSSYKTTMFRRNYKSTTPQPDEVVPCEQNVSSNDQKKHGRYCRWKTRPTKRQLERELQNLKSINADQEEEIQALRAKLEEVQSLRGEQHDATTNLKDQLKELQHENEYLVSMNDKYSAETSMYRREYLQTKLFLGNTNLYIERLNANLVAAVEALKLFDCVPYQPIVNISKASAEGSDQSCTNDKAEMILLLDTTDDYIQELKACTEHLIMTSSITKLPATTVGDDLDSKILLHAHGDVPRRHLIRSLHGLQSDVFALQQERKRLLHQQKIQHQRMSSMEVFPELLEHQGV